MKIIDIKAYNKYSLILFSIIVFDKSNSGLNLFRFVLSDSKNIKIKLAMVNSVFTVLT
jgi:hypothetical protein